ncbi:hypothetical protein BAZOLSSOX_1324 [uncultured Gammaproteobacteria bacterium]|nr:hypothetical protein BAZOLSSOX_1324 [uncultured Gammaproteobacteria bacterium]
MLIHHHTGGLENQRMASSQKLYYSPPHRWLRKAPKHHNSTEHNSPPHRWLRNKHDEPKDPEVDSPPHRWLRKVLGSKPLA